MKVTIKAVEYYECSRFSRYEEQITQMADMLRYDRAFAHRDEPGIVAFPTWSTKRDGTYHGNPTWDRWSSFGLSLRRLSSGEKNDIAYRRHLLTDQGANWVTFVHVGRGQEDLKEVTFQEWLARKEEI